MKSLLILLVTAATIGCASDQVDESVYAIDTDDNGVIDCADLDHVNACLYHHIADACAHADVNGDGVVDATDVHDIHEGLHATHHDCSTPYDHH